MENLKVDKPPKVKQGLFYQHFKLPEHMGDWMVTIIDRADNSKEFRNWNVSGSVNLKHSLNYGLNKRNVPAEYE